jgi:dCMP deaminase
MRISRDEWALRLAEVTALRGTCLRRQVGCVLTDERNRVLSTGYNGVARGMPHCNELIKARVEWEDIFPNACSGAFAKSGDGLDACDAVHAEVNAVIACHDTGRIRACYVTVSPCISCLKMLMNTGCWRIVFRETYAQDASVLWMKNGGEWLQLWRTE